MKLLSYCDENGRVPFEKWINRLNRQAEARVSFALQKLASNRLGNTKSVGSGVMELKIDFGPGYRVYFGYDGSDIVILLAGGDKRQQQSDIADAQHRWKDYKKRKNGNHAPYS